MIVSFFDVVQFYFMYFFDGILNWGLVYLNCVIDYLNIWVGDFIYVSSFDLVEDWVVWLVFYIYVGVFEMLWIGWFCQIVDGVRIIIVLVNYLMVGISIYLFVIFDYVWVGDYIDQISGLFDMVIGYDVWIGDGVWVLFGVCIGCGVIIGVGVVVGGQVFDYVVVVGNLVCVIRMCFDDVIIVWLLWLVWWDWLQGCIVCVIVVLVQGDIVVFEELVV